MWICRSHEGKGQSDHSGLVYPFPRNPLPLVLYPPHPNLSPARIFLQSPASRLQKHHARLLALGTHRVERIHRPSKAPHHLHRPAEHLHRPPHAFARSGLKQVERLIVPHIQRSDTKLVSIQTRHHLRPPCQALHHPLRHGRQHPVPRLTPIASLISCIPFTFTRSKASPPPPFAATSTCISSHSSNRR